MTEMRNQEVTKEQPLLDENGKIMEPDGHADRCGNMTGKVYSRPPSGLKNGIIIWL